MYSQREVNICPNTLTWSSVIVGGLCNPARNGTDQNPDLQDIDHPEMELALALSWPK
jgi:hypothetical protein